MGYVSHILLPVPVGWAVKLSRVRQIMDDVKIRNSAVASLVSVYPTLDLSDSEEDHVFKPRGRPKKDETWNPKGRVKS